MMSDTGDVSMNDQQFEQLLFEEESTTLDFKQGQYAFVKASDEDKSELLKDILGFANAWRRAEAFILIGVEDVRGGRSSVVGITAAEQLDDHSLQQFVNNLTNRPIPFHYEAFGFEGKQVGIIRIEETNGRPYFLMKDYGKLKKSEVYARRGSSTDPTKPAGPDELARMGSGNAWESAEASLTVDFAAAKREEAIGARMKWVAEMCRMPEADDIPILDDTPPEIVLPGGHKFRIPSVSSLSLHDRLNADYFVELANYIAFHKLIKEIRLVVTNTGKVPANDVRLEIAVPNGEGVGVFDWPDVPDKPERRESMLVTSAMKDFKIRPALQYAGYVDIERNDHQMKIEINCGSLQPGRKVWSDTFFLGVGQTGEVEIRGTLYAANLSKPHEFQLSIDATIDETTMSVDDLLALDESPSENEDDEDDD